jgi:hypothetical protein
MPTEVKEKFSSLSAFNITLTSLAGSAANVGRASDFVDNSSTRYGKVLVYVKLTQAATATGNKAAFVYALRSDGIVASGTDGITGNAAYTFLNAPILGVVGNKASPAAGEAVFGEFVFDNPGPKFGIGVSHDMSTALTANTGDNYVQWLGVNPESV